MHSVAPGENVPVAEEIYRLMGRGRRLLWMALAAELERQGQSIFVWQTVCYLARKGPTSQRDLAYANAQHPAGMSRLLHELGPAADALRSRIRGPVGIDMHRVRDRAAMVSANASRNVESWLRGMKGCTVFQGQARLEGPQEVRVDACAQRLDRRSGRDGGSSTGRSPGRLPSIAPAARGGAQYRSDLVQII